MRKLIVLSATVVLGGWVMSGTAAKADLGCVCMSPGKAACVSGLSACWPSTGICTLPCDYSTVAPAKKMSKKKMSKKQM